MRKIKVEVIDRKEYHPSDALVVCKVCGWCNAENGEQGEVKCRLCGSTLRWRKVTFWCWLKGKKEK